MSATVTAPDGRTWKVRRQWVPRLGSETLWGRFTRRVRRRTKGEPDRNGLDAGDTLHAFDLDGFVVALAIIAFLVFMFFLGWPLLMALVDVLVVLVLLVVGVIARVVFRRPWTIEARATGTDEVRHWRIVGWRASEAHRRSVEARLWSGVDPGGLPANSSP